MREQESQHRRGDLWGGPWNRVLHGLPYALLITSTVLAVLHSQPWSARATTLALAAVAGGWYAWWITAHRAWVGRLGPMLAYFAGLLVLTWALLIRDFSFVWFTMGVYFQAFVLLPGVWAYLGVVGVATVVLSASVRTANGGQASFTEYLPGFVFSVVLAGGIGLLVRAIEAQSDRRKQAIIELELTSRQLAALAEENAGLQSQLLGQAREAGVLDERQRMAREIHDTLAQGLAGIITQLEAAGGVLGDQERLRYRLDMARTLAGESLAEARRSVQALRPEPLVGAQLPDALSSVARRWSTTTGVRAAVICTGSARPLHPEVEVTLLRTVQEALANAARHASASKVGVTLSYMEDVVVVDVRDDGVGFDPAAFGHDGVPLDRKGDRQRFGLTAMRHRVTRLAGTLAVESSPGRGTAICATIPAIPPRSLA